MKAKVVSPAARLNGEGFEGAADCRSQPTDGIIPRGKVSRINVYNEIPGLKHYAVGLAPFNLIDRIFPRRKVGPIRIYRGFTAAILGAGFTSVFMRDSGRA